MSLTFDSPLAFALHLAERAAVIDRAAHSALNEASKVIEKAAKDQIGHYQAAIGPFPEWQELSASTKQDRISQGYSENEPLLRAGDLRDSITHEVSGLEAVIGSDSDIASYQELGTSTIPPRPFLGPAAIKSRKRVEEILGAAVVGAMLYGDAGYSVRLADYEGVQPEGNEG
ncbi:MAG: hypothetical protein M0Z99_12950 [Betaproteobacteria bacterium]|nr:hypothetical protein [Betaproteobacteria bacterium]